MATVVSVGSGKGDVGKSVVVASLGSALARAGRRVVLADLDVGGVDLATLFGVFDAPRVWTTSGPDGRRPWAPSTGC